MSGSIEAFVLRREARRTMHEAATTMNRRAALFAGSWIYSVSFKVKINILSSFKWKEISEYADSVIFSVHLQTHQGHAFNRTTVLQL